MMRIAIAGAVGVTLGYMEAGAVAWFGCIIILGLAFLSKDVQGQTEQITGALESTRVSQSELIEAGFTEVGDGIAGMRRELMVIASALHATNRKLDQLAAAVTPGDGSSSQGPWGAR